jgi:hypothetical protein
MKERKAFLMRIDPALWADLEAWAQDELRSVNGQVEMILKQAVIKRKGAAQKASDLIAEEVEAGLGPVRE